MRRRRETRRDCSKHTKKRPTKKSCVGEEEKSETGLMQFPVKRRGMKKRRIPFPVIFVPNSCRVAAKHGIEEEGKAAISGIGGPRSAQARQRRV